MSYPLRRKFDMESESSLTGSNISQEFMSDLFDMNPETLEPPRKKRFRAKLDHLTHEQKLERRKEKNRIAAQTARDRKRTTMELLRIENKRREAELRKKDQEIELLKAQVKFLMENCTMPVIAKSENVDSGVSELSDSPVKSPPQMNTTLSEASEMEILPTVSSPTSQNNIHLNRLRPQSPESSTSDVYSASPIPDIFIDSMVGEALNEEECIDEILKLEKSVYSEYGNGVAVGPAASICELLPRAQGTPYQSLSVENSAGWTSIQLMLLILITKVHRLFSVKTNCCAMSHNNTNDFSHGNLYDYIHQSGCHDYRRAAESIISNKNNIRHQRLVALEFVYMYIYSNPLFRRLRHNHPSIPTG